MSVDSPQCAVLGAEEMAFITLPAEIVYAGRVWRISVTERGRLVMGRADDGKLDVASTSSEPSTAGCVVK